jgi:hypothetical protein
VKIDLVNGVQPVSVDSVEQTARELTDLLRDPDAAPDLGAHVSALEAAQIAHRIGAGLVAVLRHPTADPALLIGVLVTGTTDGMSTSDDSVIREVLHGHTAHGHPVTFIERVASIGQLLDVVTDPDRRRAAVFTLSSPSGRGWLALSTLFGQVVSSVDFRD